MRSPKEKYSILIVEDEVKIAKILITYLKLYPKFSNVVVASDGVEAMQKISNQTFDLIITDLNMPKRDGLSFIDSIRKVPKYYKQKIIVISGCLTQEKAAECIRKNVKQIIVKPFTARQILYKSIRLLKCEEYPRSVVDNILERVARRFLLEEIKNKEKAEAEDDFASFVEFDESLSSKTSEKKDADKTIGDLNKFIDNNKTYLYVDVGGGSTEFTVIHEGKQVASKSFKISSESSSDCPDF